MGGVRILHQNLRQDLQDFSGLSCQSCLHPANLFQRLLLLPGLSPELPMLKQSFIALIFLLASVSAAYAATLPAGFTETSISGLSNPTAMEIAPDGRIFVCQQGGSLRVIKNGVLLSTPFLTVSVDPNGERGLLGIAFDPNFATNNFLYVYYTVPSTPRHNRVSRFTANGDVVVPGSEQIILELDNLSSATNHNGGAIHFGPDGKLYVAVGENANSSNAQTLSNRLGKVLRINSNGTIPTDNPFFNTAAGNNRSIWALGLRNPFTFAFQPGTGRMFINDVGEVTWEEINDGIAGSNYGWPNTEGRNQQSRVSLAAACLSTWLQCDDWLRDRGWRFLQSGNSAISGEFCREIFLRGSVQWLDQSFRSVDGNGIGFCDEHLVTRGFEGWRGWESLLSCARFECGVSCAIPRTDADLGTWVRIVRWRSTR